MPPQDLNKLFRYWLDLAKHEYKFATFALNSEEFALGGLFHLHLSMEAMLKACIVKRQHEHAPYSHNLEFLAGRSGIKFSEQKINILKHLNDFNIIGRYPEEMVDLLKKSKKEVLPVFIQVKELQAWLSKQLKTKS